MVISLAQSRTRLSVLAQSLSGRTRRRSSSVSRSPLLVPDGSRAHEHIQRSVPSPNLYTLALEEEEPTWEDAEWQ